MSGTELKLQTSIGTNIPPFVNSVRALLRWLTALPLRGSKVVLDGPRLLNIDAHPLTFQEAPVIRKVKVQTGSGEGSYKCNPCYFVMTGVGECFCSGVLCC